MIIIFNIFPKFADQPYCIISARAGWAACSQLDGVCSRRVGVCVLDSETLSLVAHMNTFPVYLQWNRSESAEDINCLSFQSVHSLLRDAVSNTLSRYRETVHCGTDCLVTSISEAEELGFIF